MQFRLPAKQTHPTSGPTLRIIPLGGNGLVTKNMYVYEYGDDIIVVDCGMGFPEESMLGIDMVIPDITYLLERKRKIRAIFITHGHEDHIGALPFLAPQLGVPIYATKLTAGLIRVKLKEREVLNKTKVIVFDPSEVFTLGSFRITAFRVSHSIPDAVGFGITTPAGLAIHTGDYKFDWTPVDGKPTDVAKITALTKDGCLVLLSDSLRSEKPGTTLTELKIQEQFENEMRSAIGRVLITTFSSNISRIQQAINASVKFGRRVGIVGRSMENNMVVARELGYISYPQDLLIPPKDFDRVPPKNTTLIVAGSQGQSGSALTRISRGEHKFISIKPGDLVIFSSDPIPGHQDAVHSVIDNLTRLGAEVRYSDIIDDFHVSGHGSQSELLLMLSLCHPKYLIPISGMYRQMKQLGVLAEHAGMDPKNIFVEDEGTVFEFTQSSARITQKIELNNVMVDGLGVGDIGNVVLRDRKVLSEEGVVVVIVTIKKSTGEMIGEPDIVSRGFVYMKESEGLINEAKAVVRKTLEPVKVVDWHNSRDKIIDQLEKFLYERTERRPMILPVVVQA